MRAAEWAARVRDLALVRVAARHAVSGGQAVANALGRRMILLAPYRALLQSMTEVGDVSRDGLALRAELYRVVMLCLADDAQWETGLTVAEEAFAVLTQQYTGRLWGSRLMFQSKLGQDVTLSLAAMRQVGPRVVRGVGFRGFAKSAVSGCKLPASKATCIHGPRPCRYHRPSCKRACGSASCAHPSSPLTRLMRTSRWAGF